jgi:hypothetical protein
MGRTGEDARVTQEFRFPIPSPERIVLVTMGLLGTGLVVGIFVLLARLGADVGTGLLELTGRSAQLRAALVGLVLVHTFASTIGVHYMRRWAATVLTFDDEDRFVRFRQPGAVPGAGVAELGFAVDAVERLELIRRRAGGGSRIELHVRAGRDLLRLPLEHVVESPRRIRSKRPNGWHDHPVVVAFSERTGLDVDAA